MRNPLSVPAIAAFLATVMPHGAGPGAQPVSALEVSGPFSHANLAVFLFHAAAGPKPKPDGLLSLEEALDRRQVRIVDRGDVNRLWARNLGQTPIYLQGGDIVKGGRQDRVLEHDSILEPGDQDTALAVFCVEQGRWHARGNEPVGHFSSSKNALVTRKQKLAAKAAASQTAVWQSVAEAQETIAAKVGAPVRADVSATSLQLSLENQRVSSSVEPIVAALQDIVNSRPDVVGYAFAVNGELSAADVYGSPVLFKKLWPKLLRASAVEAVAEGKPGVAGKPITAEAVKAFVAAAERGKSSHRQLSPRTSLERKETGDAVMFDTSGEGGAPVHKSYLRK
jgi:hypothetical protein